MPSSREYLSLLGLSLRPTNWILFFLGCKYFLLCRWESGMRSPFPVPFSKLSETPVWILGLVTAELDLFLQVDGSAYQGKRNANSIQLLPPLTLPDALFCLWFTALCILLWTYVPSWGSLYWSNAEMLTLLACHYTCLMPLLWPTIIYWQNFKWKVAGSLGKFTVARPPPSGNSAARLRSKIRRLFLHFFFSSK